VRFLLAEEERGLAVDLQDGQLDLPELPDPVLAGRLQQVRLGSRSTVIASRCSSPWRTTMTG
jgi:hypothetical protein